MKLSKKQIHTKSPLPSGKYQATITQGYFHEKVDHLLILCHTVDTGDFAYQHALAKFPLMSNVGQARLKKMSDGIEFSWFVDDTEDPLFAEQFIALRAEIDVEQILDNRRKIIYNKIIEWRPAIGKPEWNVMSEKTLEAFKSSKQKGKPNLPIQ